MIDSQLCWMTINYRQFCQFLMPSLCHGHKNGDFIWTYLMRWVLQSCKVSHFTEFLVQLWMWNLSLDHSTELMTSSRNCAFFRYKERQPQASQRGKPGSSGWQKKLWMFAIKAVLSDVHKRLSHLSANYIVWRRYICTNFFLHYDFWGK